jgi:hypothetical protein
MKTKKMPTFKTLGFDRPPPIDKTADKNENIRPTVSNASNNDFFAALGR